MVTQVPAEAAGVALTRFLTDLLSGWPEWLAGLYDRVRELVRLEAEGLPERHAQATERLVEVRRQIGNLVRALATARCEISAVEEALSELQQEAKRLEEQVAAYSPAPVIELPGDDWLAEQLRRWVVSLDGDTDRTATVLRQAVGPVVVEAVIPPGKKRGRPRLRLRVNGWAVLGAVLGDRLPAGTASDPVDGRDASPEVVLDLGKPLGSDRRATKAA